VAQPTILIDEGAPPKPVAQPTILIDEGAPPKPVICTS